MFNNLDTPQVPSGEPGGAATPAAPSAPIEPVAPATPSTPQSNAEAQRVAQLEAQLAKYEQDVRAVKSISDKRYSDAERQWRSEREQLRQELESLKLSSMDEDQRKKYEASLAVERQQEILQEAERSKQVAQEAQATLQALQYFSQQGVPTDKLVIDQGYDALFNSGMAWMSQQLQTLRTSPPAQPPVQPSNTLPTPPTVATAGQGVPQVKPTWDDLRKKYGDDEQIYKLVEVGLLPPDIIPS